jgi:hypothetical protein
MTPATSTLTTAPPPTPTAGATAAAGPPRWPAREPWTAAGGHARGIPTPSSPASSRAWTPPSGRSPGWRSTWTRLGHRSPPRCRGRSPRPRGPVPPDGRPHDRGDQSGPGPRGRAGGPAAGNHGSGRDRDGDGSRRGQQHRAGRHPGSRRDWRPGCRPPAPAAPPIATPHRTPSRLILGPRRLLLGIPGPSIPGPPTCPPVVGHPERLGEPWRSTQRSWREALAPWTPSRLNGLHRDAAAGAALGQDPVGCGHGLTHARRPRRHAALGKGRRPDGPDP